MYDNIKVTLDSGIATVTLDRPEKLNAFAGHMRRDLAEALEHAGGERAVRVVVVTGAGRGFCAGADVKFMDELMRRDDVEEFTRLLGAGRRVLTAIRQMTKPVIAAVNGPAYGAGFNLALACDLRVAAESASFSQSFVKVGLHPDWGGTYFLPRVVPSNIACEMFFLGETFDAAAGPALRHRQPRRRGRGAGRRDAAARRAAARRAARFHRRRQARRLHERRVEPRTHAAIRDRGADSVLPVEGGARARPRVPGKARAASRQAGLKALAGLMIFVGAGQVLGPWLRLSRR